MKTLKKLFYCLLMFGLLLAISSSASAQTVETRSLTLDGAERVIAAAKAEASKVKAPGGVIAVVDAGGNLMALERLDGTFAAGANISIGKARTAVLLDRKSTRLNSSHRQKSYAVFCFKKKKPSHY